MRNCKTVLKRMHFAFIDFPQESAASSVPLNRLLNFSGTAPDKKTTSACL
jgi:hypothetical protein